MDTEARDLKVRENRLRRAAERQGMFLSRRRRRDPNALDFGRYALFRDGQPIYGATPDPSGGYFYSFTLGQIEAILNAGEAKAEPPRAEEVPVAAEPPSVERAPHPAPPLVPRRRGLGARTSRRGR